ncbi:hypothetical protein A4G19_02260 [Pasteurellaceae bacterium Macca]|nr:hypothetical protein [Pasteurellaceae bacterium Macca]
MKKTLLTLSIAMLFTHSFAIAEEYEAPNGVIYELNENGEFARLRATGEAELEIGDNRDIRTAKTKAQMRAKASIAKFLTEGITAVETLDNIEKTLTEHNGTDKKVDRKTAEEAAEKIQVESAEILKGIVTTKTDVDTVKKRVIVEVGYSPRSQKIADSINNNLKSDLSGGKTTEEQNAKPNGETQPEREIRKAKNYDNF